MSARAGWVVRYYLFWVSFFAFARVVFLVYHSPSMSVRDTVIRRVGSQVDLASTLLAQLRIPSDGYRWGHDLLAPRTTPFAYYAFNDGFGVVDSRGAVVFDNLARRVVYREGDAGDQEARIGMALLQLSYQEYLDR